MLPFTCRGVDETDGLRLKIEAVGLLAIEFIAHNRTA